MTASSSNLAARKLSLIQLLSSTDDETVIAQIENIFEKVSWDDLSDEIKESIERGIKDANEGRKISFDEFLKKRRNR